MVILGVILLIVGLLAQGTAPYEAAIAGLYLQSAAARLYAAEIAPHGLLAGDLIARIPRAIAGLSTSDPVVIL